MQAFIYLLLTSAGRESSYLNHLLISMVASGYSKAFFACRLKTYNLLPYMCIIYTLKSNINIQFSLIKDFICISCFFWQLNGTIIMTIVSFSCLCRLQTRCLCKGSVLTSLTVWLWGRRDVASGSATVTTRTPWSLCLSGTLDDHLSSQTIHSVLA